MRFLVYIAFVLLLFSCTKEEEKDYYVVQSILLNNESFEGVFVSKVSFNNVASYESNLRVYLSDGIDEVQLEEKQLGNYNFGDDSLVITSGIEYSLRIESDKQTISASAVVPPSIDSFTSTSDTLTIDTTSTGSYVLGLNWSAIPDYRFVLDLEPLEDSLELIPFSVASGLFAETFEFPLLQNSANVFDVDFAYFGEHEIELYCIDPDYESVFFFSPDEFGEEVKNAPSNINGAYGYFTAASKRKTKVFLK